MDPFALTRALIDIDSVTPNELEIGKFLYETLSPLAEKHGGKIERIEVEPDRYNVWAWWGEPVVVFSTHMDTVPPHIPSSEDDEFIWGRGACDTHGICAAMIRAVEEHLDGGGSNVGLLLVVGEETNGAGAHFANRNAPAVKYLINGEPTENLLALGSKGSLRLDLKVKGKAAHSAYPELGDSAIHRLLDNIERLRKLDYPTDEVLGDTTINIGTICGGRASNIIADHAAATLVIRVVSDIDDLKSMVFDALDAEVEVKVETDTPALRLNALPGFETSIVKYTTDIPKLSNWGQPLLLGPGSIEYAHTLEERIPKKQITEAVDLYKKLAKQLQTT